MSSDVSAKGHSANGWASYAPLLAVLLIFLGSVAFALAKSSALERDMRIAATQNMLWVVTQTQMEMLQLALAAGQATPDRQTIAQRFDLTMARLNLMQQGPQARYLDDLGHLQVVAEMTRALETLDPLENGHSDDLHAALFELGAQLHPQINRIANDVMTRDWEKAAERLDDYRATQRLIIAAMAFALLSALGIAWLVLRNQRRLHGAQLDRLRAAALLQQERDSSAMYRDFAAIVSHQIRTPLSLIDSAMHRLHRKGADVTAAEVAERRAVVGEAVGRLTRLVDTVLMLAKLDTDQLRARFTSVPLEQSAQALVDEIRQRFPDREITLTCDPGLMVARGDPHLVAHILGNLVSNALRYSPANRPVALQVHARAGEVGCSVRDRGPGIDARDLPHLFKRYYRGTQGSCGEGTGLGLALAQELATLQGGRVEVENAPGTGAVFTLWLPMAEEGGADA